MHRTIGYLSKRLTQIRPGEEQKVLLTFCYFFLVITAYYVIKPVSRSLVLGELGSRMVPYVDLICALLMGPVVTLFAHLVNRMSKPRLVSVSFWAVIGVLVVFWRLLAWPIPWVAGAFYVWVAIFSVLVVTLFWLVANDLYHPREARRLFGFIGSGGILGGIVGSSIAAVGAQLLGTEHLLLLSSALLALCWLLVKQLWKFAPARTLAEGAAPGQARRKTFLADVTGFAKLLAGSRYLLLLVAMVGFNKLIATLIYYQLNPFIEQTFPDQDARTTFTSMFFGGMNIAAFLVQFFLTSWILRRLGLLTALLALPVGLLAGTGGLLCIPALWLAATTELYDGALNYSLQQTTKEVLYLPIDRSIRYKVKPFIDMVVFRFGKGVAAVIGIVVFDVLAAPSQLLSVLAIPVLVAWVAAAVWLRRDYVATIRMILQARALSRHPQPVQRPRGASDEARDLSDGSGAGGAFGTLTDGRPLAQKLALVNQLVSSNEPKPPGARDLIEQLMAQEAQTDHQLGAAQDAGQLKAILWSGSQPMAKRRQAVRLLAKSPDQGTVDYLLGVVLVEEESLLRQEALLGLVKLRLQDHRLGFPVEPIRRQLAREVAAYRRIAHVAAIYRQQARVLRAGEDPVMGLLRALMEESVAQIFRFLMLLYRAEDVHLVYEQMRVSDAHVRADAVELLDNLVEPAVRAILFPILDEDRFLSVLEEESPVVRDPARAYRVLQEAIWDHNCWLSVTTLCAIGRLRLNAMQQELERAVRHPAPVISAAARVAIYLSTHP